MQYRPVAMATALTVDGNGVFLYQILHTLTVILAEKWQRYDCNWKKQTKKTSILYIQGMCCLGNGFKQPIEVVLVFGVCVLTALVPQGHHTVYHLQSVSALNQYQCQYQH